MTLNNRHIKNTSFTPSPAHAALKKGGKSDRDNSRSDSLLSKALKRLVGVLLWAILKPIFRGVGWIISILTAIGISGCSPFLSVLNL